MAKHSTYAGYYIGVDQNGDVKRVSEYHGRGGVELQMMRQDASIFRHVVLTGRQAKSEVVIVFSLSDSEFISAASAGGDYERSTVARVEEKAKAKRESKC